MAGSGEFEINEPPRSPLLTPGIARTVIMRCHIWLLALAKMATFLSLKGLSALFWYGICLPDTCSREDLRIALEGFTENEMFEYRSIVMSCEAGSDDYDWNKNDKIIM